MTSRKNRALSHHSANVIIHGKVIKMEHLNESQLRAQAVRLIEENYSYSVTAKKLGRSKAWVGKWAKCWKANAAESMQSQSPRRLTNKTASKFERNHTWNCSQDLAKANIKEVTACKNLKEMKGKNFQEAGSRYGISCLTSLSGDI